MCSSLLKLDGRTTKGRNWKEHFDSGTPLKQGLVISSKLCSHCNETPDIKLDTVKCMKCSNVYHYPCLLYPLKQEYIKDLSENPCLWWYCLDCLSIKNDNEKSANTTNDNENEFVKKSDLSCIMNYIKKSMSDLKSHVDSKLEKVASHKASPSLTNVINNNSPELNMHATYAKQVSANIPTIDNVISSQLGVTDKESGKSKADYSQPMHDNSNHVVLLKPNVGKQTSCLEIMKLINSSVQGLEIEYCRPRKSGIIALGVTDENHKQEILKRLNENTKITANYTAKLPQGKQPPKITVSGISELVFDGCAEDEDEMKKVLVDEILARNSTVNDIIQSCSEEEDFIKVLFLKKVNHKYGQCSYTAAIKVSPKVRHSIHLLGNKLFVYLNRCKVFDRFYVTQCFRCQKIGHTSDKCDSPKPVCKYCAQEHESKTCDKKDDHSIHCCANCLTSNIDDHKKNARNHNASSFKCPFYINSVLSIKQNTIDWLPKNC